MKYLRKAWDIEKQDIEKINANYKSDETTRLTRNFIYDFIILINLWKQLEKKIINQNIIMIMRY